MIAQENHHREQHISQRGPCEPDCHVRFGKGVEWGYIEGAESLKSGQNEGLYHTPKHGIALIVETALFVSIFPDYVAF